MRKSKKVLSLMMAVAMMTALLSGCATEEVTETATAEATTEVATETETETETEDAFDLTKYEEQLAEDMISSHLEYAGPTEEAIAPEGKKLAVIMSTATHQGQYVPAEAVKEAAEAVGWECELYDGKGDAAEYNKLILQVCESNVDAIVTVAMDPAVIQSGLQTADELGIPVVGCSQAIDTPNPVKEFDGLSYAFEVAPDMQEVGRMVGNWIVVDSGG